jgi:hypothetical protein
MLAASCNVADAVLTSAKRAGLVGAHTASEGSLVVPDCAVTIHEASTASPKLYRGALGELHGDASVDFIFNSLPGSVVEAVHVAVPHPVFFVHVGMEGVAEVHKALHSRFAVLEDSFVMGPKVRRVRWRTRGRTCDVNPMFPVRCVFSDSIDYLVSYEAVVGLHFAEVDVFIGADIGVI